MTTTLVTIKHARRRPRPGSRDAGPSANDLSSAQSPLSLSAMARGGCPARCPVGARVGFVHATVFAPRRAGGPLRFPLRRAPGDQERELGSDRVEPAHQLTVRLCRRRSGPGRAARPSGCLSATSARTRPDLRPRTARRRGRHASGRAPIGEGRRWRLCQPLAVGPCSTSGARGVPEGNSRSPHNWGRKTMIYGASRVVAQVLQLRYGSQREGMVRAKPSPSPNRRKKPWVIEAYVAALTARQE